MIPLTDFSSYFIFLAAQINSNLCDKFSVKYYPMLLWGPPKKLVGWDPKQENNEILTIERGRTADILLGWINKQLGRYI